MNDATEEIITLDVEKLNFADKEATKELFCKLLNFIEFQAQEIRRLNEIIQQQSDEIARLKGEKGKPKIAPKVPPRDPRPLSKERSKKWSKDAKNPKIKTDRVVFLAIKPDTMPQDAEYRGYSSIIIQNIKLQTDNIEYWREHYYSQSMNKHYYAKLPDDVQNTQFGSDLKALVAELYFIGRVTENRIHSILTDFGIIISEGEISNILTKEKSEVFTTEKTEIFQTGMRRATYFQADETGARHKGENWYMHYFGSEEFSTFFIEKSKSSETIRSKLGLLDGVLTPTPMMTDGGRQYQGIASHHALCWIHEIRYYKMLKPHLDYHKSILKKFMDNLWNFYDLLKRYKSDPSINLRGEIERQCNDCSVIWE